MENKARIDFDFKKGFLLEEDDILKINEIIKSRFNNLPKSILKYRIRRSDLNEYITDNLDVVLKEENCNGQEIVSFTFLAESDTTGKVYEYDYEYCLSVSFSKKEGTNLNISGIDRDLVFLLKSDLKNYLDNNVNKGFVINNKSEFKSKSILALMLLIMLTLVSFLFSISSPETNIEDILKSLDVNEKLNYIIQKSHDLSSKRINIYPYYTTGILGLSMLLIFFDLIPKIITFLFPSNIFYIGKYMKIYDRKISFRNNIFWVVGIGLIVGIVASLVANRL